MIWDRHDRWKLGLDLPAEKLAGNDVKTDINWQSVEIDGVWPGDYPDFCDAYISYAEFKDGTQLDDDELEKASDWHADWVNDRIHALQLYKR
jgi:hypothetical protein